MAIPNVNQLTSQLRMLPDPALRQAAMMYKNDPYILPMIISEDTARKQMRMATQMQMAGQEPPKVADQAVAAIGQQPMPPQGAPAPAGLPTLRTGMQNMADGGIAGYPDEDEIVGMAEGGVARYNGQTESRVKPDVQFARDQEAFRVLLSELKAAQAKAAQGDQRAQGDVEAIQGELRRHIKRNPSFAQMLTSALPMGSAQAAPAAQAAASAAPAAPAAPVSAPQGGALAGFGKGIASLADVLMSPVPFAVKQVGYAASRPFMSAAEAEKLSSETAAPFQDIIGKTFGVTQDPAYQQEMSRRVAGFIGENINKGSLWIAKQLGIPEEDAINMVNTLSVAAPQAVTGVSKIPAAGRAVYERVAPQKGKLTPQQIERLAEENRVAEVQRAQREAMAGGATLEEQAGLAQLIQRRQQAERPSAAYALQQKTQAQPQGRILAGASKTAEQARLAAAYGRPDVAAAEGQAPPSAARGPMSDAERAKFMEANTQELASSLPKEDKKDIIDAAKAATPKAERKGLTNDDYLVMGLTMMANPGRGRGLQGLLEAVGTGGMAAVQSKLAREKTEREMAKEESEAKYREALGEQARRGPSEIALIERVAKENNIPFTKALELVAGAKREPQTEEALMKAWSSSAFLQMQYPNPQDYIKLMRASTGGVPSAAGSEGFRVIGSRPAP